MFLSNTDDRTGPPFYDPSCMTSSRRNHLKTLLAAAGGASLAGLRPVATSAQTASASTDHVPPPDHERRIRWWHEAKFGMFIHWGLYSVLASTSGPRKTKASRVAIRDPRQATSPQAQRRARLGAAGQACRPEVHGDDHQTSRGLLPVGFASSPTTTPWSRGRAATWCASLLKRPAPRACAWASTTRSWTGTTPTARLQNRRGCSPPLRRLHPRPHPRADDQLRQNRHPLVRRRLAARLPTGGSRERMNEMVFSLQPEIIVNNRNGLPGDFSTPEQHITADGRPRLGNLHDPQRQLGIQSRRRRLENAQTSSTIWSSAPAAAAITCSILGLVRTVRFQSLRLRVSRRSVDGCAEMGRPSTVLRDAAFLTETSAFIRARETRSTPSFIFGREIQ